MFPAPKPKKAYSPKPYEQMTYPVNAYRLTSRLFQGAVLRIQNSSSSSTPAIDEFSACASWAPTRNSPPTPQPISWKRPSPGSSVAASLWNVFRQTTALNLPTASPIANETFLPASELSAAKLGIRHKLIRPYTPRHNGKVERSHRGIKKRFTILIVSILSPTLVGS